MLIQMLPQMSHRQILPVRKSRKEAETAAAVRSIQERSPKAVIPMKQPQI
jgi:hypothetical protein